jgi:DNA-binding response OmpR family regulator
LKERDVEKILIVEDDPSTAGALELRMRAAGYFPLVANDAVQAGRLAARDEPDLIVLDISLPGGSGLVVAERLKKRTENAGMPIIFLTGQKDPLILRQALDLCPAALIEKPYEIDELLGAVKSALASSRRQKASSNGERQGGAKAAKRILVVEDDEHIAMALALRFKAAGYDTVVAFDAILGLSSAVSSAPDVMVLDISMPGGSGLELAQKVRTIVPEPPPTIFLTASRQPQLREKALELGAVAFFEKPYEAEDLMAAVRASLAETTNSQRP